jgi:hypothetical protein
MEGDPFTCRLKSPNNLNLKSERYVQMLRYSRGRAVAISRAKGDASPTDCSSAPNGDRAKGEPRTTCVIDCNVRMGPRRLLRVELQP